MPIIALEMERLRNPYSGLGQYCLHLGHAFAAGRRANDPGFACLVPEERMGEFGREMRYKAVKPWHKIMAPRLGESLWHAMHQDSEYLPRFRKTPVVITIHDLNFLDRPDYSDRKKQRRLAALQSKINRAKGLIYISEYVREWVHANLKVPAATLERVIYNGGRLTTDTTAATKSAPPSFTAPFLFSIGIHPKKNYHVLMPILAENKDYQWIIAGPDSRGYRSKIEQEAKRYGVLDRIVFCGPVGDEAKRHYYEQCSALLFPSLSEGFGLPVVEAMSLGKPVFLSDRTSLPEIGGTEAYYFRDFDPETLIKTFAEGMSNFKNDPEKAERMKYWASRFSWEKAAGQYLDFYNKLLQINP
jgi:glycosyltransferase involved in cell wall biosynthesis